MSHAELRAKAILTLVAANFDYQKPAHARGFIELPATIRLMLVEKMEAAFDALGKAGFRVSSLDFMEDMERTNSELPHNTPTWQRLLAMLAAGDLTRKSE